jgi:hypothetical protein
MKIVRYVKQTGEILCILTLDTKTPPSAYADADHGVLQVADNFAGQVDAMYVTNGAVQNATQITLQASTALAAPGESVTVTGIPNPAWVLNSQTQQLTYVTNGQYTFTSTTEDWVGVILQGKYYGQIAVEFSNLASHKAKAKAEVDYAAEAARSRVVTPGSGQAMTYLRKADAAVAFLAGATLTAAQQARIDDEAARLGVTDTQAAQSLVDTANQWEMLDASIDNLRLVAKKNIDAATSGTAINAVVAGIDWPV